MSHHAKTGGILTIISGIFCFFFIMMAIFYALIPRWIMNIIIDSQPLAPGQDMFPMGISLFFTIFGVITSIFFAALGALAIIGGIFALKKKNWAVAIAGAIAGTVLMFPCGIAATILISLGRSEFTAGAEATSPDESQQQYIESQVIQNKSTTAGVLTIISGVFGILWLGYALFINNMFSVSLSFAGLGDPAFFMNQMYQMMGIMYIVWGSVAAALGIFTVIAGVMTLRKSNWRLGLAGTIAGTLTFFPCGIPAIILIHNAYNEFSADSKPATSMTT
ncbi:MAG: hypothetical protein P8105_04185 [Dehalococcoidia bacterium]